MKVIVRLTLFLAGFLWLFFVFSVFLKPPELCGSIPGYLSPDDLSLRRYRDVGTWLCTWPMFFTMVCPRQITIGRVMLGFGVVMLASALAALCCHGLMQHLSLANHCGGVTVN